MEKFKTDIYKEETGKSFDEYIELKDTDRYALIKQIEELVHISGLNEKLFPIVEKKLNFKSFDEDFTFDLKGLLETFNLQPEDQVFVIWDENSIDKFDGRFLSDNWTYIWYGASDDAVLLYFEKQKRLLLVNHYGRVGSF